MSSTKSILILVTNGMNKLTEGNRRFNMGRYEIVQFENARKGIEEWLILHVAILLKLIAKVIFILNTSKIRTNINIFVGLLDINNKLSKQQSQVQYQASGKPPPIS